MRRARYSPDKSTRVHAIPDSGELEFRRRALCGLLPLKNLYVWGLGRWRWTRAAVDCQNCLRLR